MIKTEIVATVVADSINPQKDRLTSVLVTMPRIILSEMNTHRMLSKNTSSSRAIPFHKMVEAVQNNPFIPIAWQKDHKGMQGSEYLTAPIDVAFAHDIWLEGRDRAIKTAKALNNKDFVTKQLCNRLLEPFMWTTMLITGSREGWDNFFELRNPVYEWEYEEGIIKAKSKEEFLEMFIQRYPTNGEKDLHDWEAVDEHFNPVDSNFWRSINKGQAEIHMMALAESIYDAVNESTPKQLEAGDWHIPFEDKIIEDGYNKGLLSIYNNYTSTKVKISTAMAAHTSYTIVGGEAVKSYEKWIELHDKLITYEPPHSSPMEHCARAMSEIEYTGSKKTGYSTIKGGQDDGKGYGWCNNFKGFIPYRYFIDNKIEL